MRGTIHRSRNYHVLPNKYAIDASINIEINCEKWYIFVMTLMLCEINFIINQFWSYILLSILLWLLLYNEVI